MGHAIRAYAEAHGLEGFEYTDIDEFDFSDPKAYDKYDWSLYGTIINAGAYTAVDRAETAGAVRSRGRRTRRARLCSPGSRRTITSRSCT